MIQTSGYLEQTDYQSQLDTHLEEAIDELREKSEQEIEDYKTSVENAYKDKVRLTCVLLHNICINRLLMLNTHGIQILYCAKS